MTARLPECYSAKALNLAGVQPRPNPFLARRAAERALAGVQDDKQQRRWPAAVAVPPSGTKLIYSRGRSGLSHDNLEWCIAMAEVQPCRPKVWQNQQHRTSV